MRRLRGGMETIIATVIIVGIVVALILSTVIPMSNQGDELLGKTTNTLVKQQTNIGPQ